MAATLFCMLNPAEMLTPCVPSVQAAAEVAERALFHTQEDLIAARFKLH